MSAIWQYIKWCWRTKEILPWSVSLVSDGDLTREAYEWPATMNGALWIAAALRRTTSDKPMQDDSAAAEYPEKEE